MSSVSRTPIHAFTNSSSTTHSSKTKSHTQVAATRANTAPPALDIRSMNNALNLTEPQRNQIRPILAADQRKQDHINHMLKWSPTANRLSTLWHARDETTAKLQKVLDPKQFETLKPAIDPNA